MREIAVRALTKAVIPVEIKNHDVHYTNDWREVRFYAVIIRGRDSSVKRWSSAVSGYMTLSWTT